MGNIGCACCNKHFGLMGFAFSQLPNRHAHTKDINWHTAQIAGHDKSTNCSRYLIRRATLLFFCDHPINPSLTWLYQSLCFCSWASLDVALMVVGWNLQGHMPQQHLGGPFYWTTQQKAVQMLTWLVRNMNNLGLEIGQKKMNECMGESRRGVW